MLLRDLLPILLQNAGLSRTIEDIRRPWENVADSLGKGEILRRSTANLIHVARLKITTTQPLMGS